MRVIAALVQRKRIVKFKGLSKNYSRHNCDHRPKFTPSGLKLSQ